jgi:formate C-acetyltransferase
MLSAPYEICIERARYYTDSYRESVGEHPAIRAAKAFERTLKNMTIYILAEERIAGNRSSKLIGTVIPVERGEMNTVLELELDALTKRERQPFRISDADRRELLQDILPYWRGKTVRDLKKPLWKENGLFFMPGLNPLNLYKCWRGLDVDRLRKGVSKPGRMGPGEIIRSINELLYNNPAMVMNVFDVQGHLILGHKNILREGFAGVKARAGVRLAEAEGSGDSEGAAFLRGVISCCDSIRDFAARFASEAERLAGSCTDGSRRGELEQIAARCRRVPFHPPRDFREAVQALWITEVGAFIAYGMTGIFAIGRIDQYLYPFFEQDRREGRITDGEAVELLEELLVKLACNLLLLPYVGKNTGNELGADSCAPTVGGVTRHGEDAVNPLSYLVLDAFANVKSLGNTFTIRLSKKTPAAFWKKAFSTYRETSGAALFNDESVVPALERCGVKPEDARDYGVIGCVEPTSDGNTFGCTSGNDISLSAAVEMTLLGGSLRIMGRRVGPPTGDPRDFETFGELMEAFKRQVSFQIDTVVKAVDIKDRVYMEGFPNPYVSATLEGCVENARDMTSGGASYNFGSISGRGLGTAADSLAAIKKLVYETGTVKMGDLLDALGDRFEGYEDLRSVLANKAPKYGRDDDEADAIAKEMAEFFCAEVSRRKTVRGGPYRPSFFSYGMHVAEGLFLGATPDGRMAGQPVSNSFSPSNGSEINGPTAALRSIAKIDHTLISNGCAVNMRFLPSLLEGEENLEKMIALVKGYFALGGMELQPNVVSTETLRDAQLHPEQYRDLAVRVSGYSALFTDLGKPLQDEIISRTEFGKL